MPTQSVTHLKPDRHKSFDRNIMIQMIYGKVSEKNTAQTMPFSAIFCHFF